MVGIAGFQSWEIHNLFPGAFTTETADSKVGKSTCSGSWKANFCLLCTRRETGSGIKNQGRVIKEQLCKHLMNRVVAFGGNLCTEGNKNGWKSPYCGIRWNIDL